MLKRLDEKFRELMINIPEGDFFDEELEGNPMAGYLKIFQKQHKIIFILYRGLILSFGALLIILSFLIYSAADNVLIPFRDTIILGVINLFLLTGLIMAIRELDKYRSRSNQVQIKIMEHLKTDVNKLEQIKVEHSGIIKSQRQMQKKVKVLSGKFVLVKVADHKGWDKRACSSCGTILEMGKEQCPSCQSKLNKLLIN